MRLEKLQAMLSSVRKMVYLVSTRLCKILTNFESTTKIDKRARLKPLPSRAAVIRFLHLRVELKL